jgi:hypothetical protein
VDYGGKPFDFIPTATGFDMEFYAMMTLHFVLAK